MINISNKTIIFVRDIKHDESDKIHLQCPKI